MSPRPSGQYGRVIHPLVWRNDLEGLAAALIRGEDPNEADRGGMTALMVAAREGQSAAMQILLDHGADTDRQDHDGFTALHFAAQENAEDCAELLLRMGAGVDIRDKHGNTPLARAVHSYRDEGALIPLLLRQGADPDATNLYGSSPRKLAYLIANYSPRRFFSPP